MHNSMAISAFASEAFASFTGVGIREVPADAIDSTFKSNSIGTTAKTDHDNT